MAEGEGFEPPGTCIPRLFKGFGGYGSNWLHLS